jgi:hypothetical protein
VVGYFPKVDGKRMKKLPNKPLAERLGKKLV